VNEILIWDIDGMIVTGVEQNTWRKGFRSLRYLTHISLGLTWGRTRSDVVNPVGGCSMSKCLLKDEVCLGG
jgi:hypothetical protein